MKAVKISDSVYWVGAIDWGLREFHGYATSRGSTYNAYLVMADKPTLVDTVKAPFKDEMMARIASVVDPVEIDTIVSNHAEMDHSGALPATIAEVKPSRVVASPMGLKALNAHFALECDITPVKTGDKLDLGGLTLSFIETRMLHWPDSMFSYLEEEDVLFSQDAFGMHLATADIFVDQNDISTVHWECEKYYANILMPYSNKVAALLADVDATGLSPKIVASDHGPIWRGKDIATALKWYAEWSEDAPSNKAVVIHDTMWGATAKMAAAICDGLKTGGAEVVSLPLASSSRSDVATEILGAGAVFLGSPTINNQMFPSLADTMTYLKGLKPKNLIGASFGAYGWSGEAVKQLNAILEEMKVELVSEGIRAFYVPTPEVLEECFALGEEVAGKLPKA
jgi:flavorubredoxin